MYWYNGDWGWTFLGMSLLWWIFWSVLIGGFFLLARPQPRRRLRDQRPLDMLARRYASGDIDDDEYDRRCARILRDSGERAVTPPTLSEPPLPST